MGKKILFLLLMIILPIIVLAILVLQKTEDNAIFEKPKQITYYNAWIIKVDGKKLTVCADGEIRELKLKNKSEIEGNVLADIHLSGDKITSIDLKPDTITGKVLSASDEYVEIKGYGKVPLDPNYRIYKTYGEVIEQSYEALIVGYEMSYFIVADGKICGAAIAKTAEPADIDRVRVLIKTDNFRSLYHQKAVVTSDKDFTVAYGDQDEKTEHYNAGEQLVIDDPAMLSEMGRVSVIASDGAKIRLLHISRAYGNPEYDGTMEISYNENGLVIVNEVAIEDYLKRVVPSEMPVGFGVEALKVQAVCARSYVYMELGNNNYVELGAHIDDSIQYQVYNNTAENADANQAIAETKGQLLEYNGEIIKTFYYSTSCGVTTDVTLWGSSSADYPFYVSKAVGERTVDTDLTDEYNFSMFIKNIDDTDYDREYDLYRWQMEVPFDVMDQCLSGLGVGSVTDIRVVRRVAGGAAVTVEVIGDHGSTVIEGENKIRTTFGVSSVSLMTINGNERHTDSLPSAFCIFEKTEEGFVITGGGYGHGIGMSQNAVNTMVKKGMDYQRILAFFYPGTNVTTADERK